MGIKGRFADAHDEHRRIVAAIEARDSEKADAEARAHVARGLEVRRQMRAVEPTNQDPL